jgi:hypothetical protein
MKQSIRSDRSNREMEAKYADVSRHLQRAGRKRDFKS